MVDGQYMLNASNMIGNKQSINYSVQEETLNMTFNTSMPFSYEYVPFDMVERVRYILGQPHQIVTITLSLLAILLNILSIMSIMRINNSLTSHYRFIISLATSDILIGVTVMAHIINNAVNPKLPTKFGPWEVRVRSTCAYITIKALNTTSLNISLLNLVGMAIDHFLAVLRPLHYPTLMKKQRATCLILSFWMIAFICGFSDFLTVYPMYAKYLGEYNYCELAYENPYQDEFTLFVIAIGSVIIMTFSYTKIFLTVKRRHQFVGPVRQEMTQNKKALFTTLLILGTFIVCWLPNCLFQIILIIQVKINKEALSSFLPILYQADKYLYGLLVLNAIFDPIIYAIRMRDVRLGYRKIFFNCCNGISKNRRYSIDATRTSVLSETTRPKRSSFNSIRMWEKNNATTSNSNHHAKTAV